MLQLDQGGRVLLDPLAVDAVSENTVRGRGGERTVVEIVLHSGKTYLIRDDSGEIMEAVANAKQNTVTPMERMAAALDNLNLSHGAD